MNPGTTPFFSVVIFTKNRSDIVGFALESVLQQSFSDFEVIISDNDDTDATGKALAQYSDPRLRYYRTNGNLSMIDNWEFAVSKARGTFILSLTDRSALKSYALSRLRTAIERHALDVFVWSHDIVYSALDQITFSEVSGEDEIVTSKELFERVLTGGYDFYSDCMPKGLNSCHSRKLLEEIKVATGGRIFLPVTPDYNLAFLTLAHRPKVVLLNEPLFVWGFGHLSNGRGIYERSATFSCFLNDAGLEESDMFSQVPIKAAGIHNTICNDLMRLKHAFPHLFRAVNLDLVSYFVVCRKEIREWISPDYPLYTEKISAWEQALAQQEESVQKEVWLQLSAIPVTWHIKLWRLAYNSRSGAKLRKLLYAFQQRRRLPPRPKAFRNILDAVKWIEQCEVGRNRTRANE